MPIKKGTSNYLANKVIPMLPHELSNGICSLNPYVERLAMSCIMEVNDKGEVVRYRGYPCLHRVHDHPNEEKLDNYLNMVSAIDLPFRGYDAEDCATSSNALQKLSEHIKDTGRLSTMLSTRLIRCMSRAKYSPINIGHNGLSKKYYCHFTSPIRRYPDLTVHRILKECALNIEEMNVKAKKWETKLPDIGMQSSRMEKIADEAEQQTYI